MTVNEEINQHDVVAEAAEIPKQPEDGADGTKTPILPDEEYAAKVAEEDPEELEKVRSRLMTLIRVKGKSLGGDTLTQQIKPMVYSMSLADCNQMCDVLNKHGMLGLVNMIMKHNKEEKKKQKK